MVSEIRIYAEGGGEGSDTKARLRAGLNGFLTSLREAARNRRVRWNIVVCGSRNNAYNGFRGALSKHSGAFNILFVDSEVPVTMSPWQHLRQEDNWQIPDASDEQCQLMVQVMETWIVSDLSALKKFYGQGFNCNAIPRVANIESVTKKQIEDSLEDATRNTTKCAYHKTRHAPKLLELIDPKAVRARARHCDRLFTTLERLLTE